MMHARPARFDVPHGRRVTALTNKNSQQGKRFTPFSGQHEQTADSTPGIPKKQIQALKQPLPKVPVAAPDTKTLAIGENADCSFRIAS
jgi:hypothetical protein